MERWRGNPRRAKELLEGSADFLQSQFNIRYANYLNLFSAWNLTELGRYNEAIPYLNQGLDIAEKNSLHFFICRYYNSLGWTYSEFYSLQKAVRFNSQALESVVALKKSPAMFYIASEIRAMTEVNIIENEVEMGKIDDAWKHIIRLEGEVDNPNFDFNRDRWSIRMKDLKGVILLKRGDLDGAEEIARHYLDVGAKRKYKKYSGRAERLFGRTLIERGACDLAETKLMQALAKLEEVENPKQLWLTHIALAKLHEKMNRHDLERKHWQEAASIIKSTADDLEDKELRTTFIDAKPVREILENVNR